MLELPRGARAPDDARMYLSYDKSHDRWYVRIKRDGRKIGIREAYGTVEFDAAYDDAVRELGGEKRMRRMEPDTKPNNLRRYLVADVSQRGQLRYYVQLRDRLPKIRIKGAKLGTPAFDRLVDRAIALQVKLYGDGRHDIGNVVKQTRTARVELPKTQPKPGTLRWYWTEYKKSDAWLGDLSIGEDGLAASTQMQRVGLIEPLLYDNGEKRFSLLTRNVIREEMKARTPTQAGNLLSALRGMIRWMIAFEHLDEDDDPTIGLKSGKSKASKISGGFVPWDENDMARYTAKWPLGTEARLMFDILRYTFLRLGDAHRFGPSHLKRLLMQIATEKSKGQTLVSMPIHPALAESLAAARAAGIIGRDVFTGKCVGGEVLLMNKKSWASKFKKFAIMAGVNEPKKNCHGVRKARAEDTAYADATESQMMKMFGWTDPKMPAHYIAKARGDKLAASGMAKLVEFDQSQNIGDVTRPRDQNERVTYLSNRAKKR